MLKKNLINCENDIFEKIQLELKDEKLTNSKIFNVFDSFDIYYLYNKKDGKQFIKHKNNTIKYLIMRRIKNEFINLKLDMKY